MLTSAVLLWIIVSGVDATSQFMPTDSGIKSLALPQSRGVAHRLKIFETFAKSNDQRHGNLHLSGDSVEPDRQDFDSDDDKSVNEILQNSLVELEEIVDAAKNHVILSESIESFIVFQSLLDMLSNRYPKETLHRLSWQIYLRKSIRNLKCSVMDLCHKFAYNFKCDPKGHLTAIVLQKMGPFDHLNLLMIPNTVEMLSMETQKGGLTSISAWSDLKGKSLKSLRIYGGTSKLNLNLDGLKGTLDYLPLDHLIVDRAQISEYFGLQGRCLSDSAPKIGEWMRSSTLTNLRVESRVSRRVIRERLCICTDGTCHYTASRNVQPRDALCP